ncbi:cyclolysin secretion ATP-binding protein [hydrothermal vent metagenome]|uniref:Cyclolysin secretion ATP-binding protein n=1 Tax=hydrothermal vent metagenome TaxID=652676 RepID=A0A3B1BE33_9ZZZZ
MPHALNSPDNPDSGLACLLFLAHYFGVPADAEQLQHEFAEHGKPLDEVALLRMARHIGFKASAVDSEWPRLSAIALPAITRQHDGRSVVIVRAEDEKVLIHDPAEPRPLTLPRDIFEQAWSGRLILFILRASSRPGERKFDFSWFVPAIIKHRKLLGEVLLAPFFIQLFALLMPLFFQVVIDKVLEHKGMMTLQVLAIGMLTLTLFDVLLSGLRTYIFSHTSSRIDVVLGAQLFRHFLRLPIAYFETRRVGDTVARVRELESIREFLTLSSVTLVIDLFFTIVFLVVMYFYSPLLTLVVALSAYLILSVIITPIIRARLHEKFNRGAENQAFLVESVSGIKTIKSMAVEPSMQQRWDEQLAGYVKAGFKANNLSNVAGQEASFINKITTILILWVGATLVMKGELSIG